jgi:hypothetical protein
MDQRGAGVAAAVVGHQRHGDVAEVRGNVEHADRGVRKCGRGCGDGLYDDEAEPRWESEDTGVSDRGGGFVATF